MKNLDIYLFDVWAYGQEEVMAMTLDECKENACEVLTDVSLERLLNNDALDTENHFVRIFEPKTIKDYYDYELEDDETETGGTSYMGETLYNFLCEIGMTDSTAHTMEEVNEALVGCGIKPIPLD